MARTLMILATVTLTVVAIRVFPMLVAPIGWHTSIENVLTTLVAFLIADRIWR